MSGQAAKRPADGLAPLFTANKAPKAPRWSVVNDEGGTCMVRTDPECKPSAKIAAFDMDGTLVTHRGDFASDPDDWRWLNPHVVPTLKLLHSRGYRLVVFSNQNGIKGAVDGKKATTVKGYFDNAFRALGVPVTAFVAPQKDSYRKGGGNVGMWDLFVKDHCMGAQPDIKASFFVGDAAGRPSDHGEGDLEFAQAVGLPFHLPEAAFSSSSSTTWPPLAVAEPQKEADVIVLDD